MSKTVDKNIFYKHRRFIENASHRHTTHGMTDTSIYYVWCAMKQRCNNKNNPKYKLYGGRGIKVCQEWEQDFTSFLNWALNNGYMVGLTLDRIDGNSNYCPENCRWTTITGQNHNLSSNRNITFNGITMCLNAWAKKLNINPNTLYARIVKKGWSIKRALTTPIDKNYVRNYKR